jgi:DnaJ-class molecular chaperone
MSRKDVHIHYTTESKKYGEVKKCGLCNGSGKDYTTALMGVKCSACNGTGYVRV